MEGKQMKPQALRVSVFHHLPTGGGIRVLASNLALLRDRFDIKVHVPEGAAELLPDPGVPVRIHPFPAGRRLSGIRRALAPLALVARLRSFDGLCESIAESIQRRDDPGLALVHNSMLVAAPPVLTHLRRCRCLYVCYEYPRHIYEPSLVKRAPWPARVLLTPLRMLEKRMDRRSCLAADGVVAISSYMAGLIRRTYSLPSTPVVARPGVDSERFRPAGGWQRGSHVLSVGALWPFKGHQTVIRALSTIPRALRPPMVLVADRELPGYGDRLESLADSLGVALRIMRSVDDSQLLDIYSNALAVVCAQRREPYGMVPLEAMACGRPVIAVSEGGFPENVSNGVTGLLVDPAPGAVSEALGRLLADDALARSLAEAGRDFVVSERTPRNGADRLSAAMVSCAGSDAELPPESR